MIITAASGSAALGGAILPSLMSNADPTPPTFLLTINPSILTLTQGASASTTITVSSLNGFTGTVALSTTLTNGTLPVTFTNNPLRIPLNGTATSTLTLTVPNPTTTGTYNLVVTGVGTGAKKVLYSSALLSILITSIADFNINATPATLTNIAGTTNSTDIILESLNGFTGTISLTVTTPFGFIGVMGGQDPVTLSPGVTGSTTLRITTTPDTTPGAYTLTVTGTNGGRSHTCALTINVLRPSPEAMVLTNSHFNTPTNLTLNIQNTGTAPVALQQYSVRDSLGDTWTMTNWAGPVIAPNSVAPANILVGVSCGQCTYTGIFGLFLEFATGQTYTVTVTTTLNNQFVFTVTR